MRLRPPKIRSADARLRRGFFGSFQVGAIHGRAADAVAWALVGVPLAYGVYESLTRVAAPVFG